MAQTIRRSGTGVRRQTAAQGRAGQVRKARAHTTGLFDRMMTALPFTEDQWHRFFTVLILAVALAVVVVIARVSGGTTLAEQYFAQVAANAGFKVNQVQVRGTERLNEARVYEKALGREDLSMVLVDLEDLRSELLGLNWVADARVARQLPDTLVVDIVERQPHAVLRRADRMVLIDRTGTELEPVSAANVGDMLVISGEGAQGQVQALEDLLDAAPALRPQIRAAEWIGNRRWNLTFATDQVLALPEGEDRAPAALIGFAQSDGVHRLIGGEVVRFDMRNWPRVFLQVPDRADRELELQQGES
ncbi:FtsQ-type POTRA domain-containing protein [Altererythrobacter sp. KTW20L]|uniref:cell division protein FtsQ/DivIB n=1 Tax=Altererythrobacter sp. KTW20L TaxID=2942210 RepID=UPI0020BFCB91|nr:FtsQ-type POTRA domain-containing protein [Altererythrobacter sp. KTW20L]MCL6252149.1 FtsQ-type POTRA domain-containing protein [Altererythrobacter sp. KTW20L]